MRARLCALVWLVVAASCDRKQDGHMNAPVTESAPLANMTPKILEPFAEPVVKSPEPVVPDCRPRLKKLVFREFNEKPTQESYPEMVEYDLASEKRGEWVCVPGRASFGASGYQGRAETVVVETTVDPSGHIALSVDRVEGSVLPLKLEKGVAYGRIQRGADGVPTLVFAGALSSTYGEKSLVCEPSERDPETCRVEW